MANNSQPQIIRHPAATAESGATVRSLPYSHPSWAAQMALFARNFFKYPSAVGWMLPSTSFVVKHVLQQIDWEKARLIVEYGPGIGTFTGEILQRMHADATLVAIEVNADFVHFLRKSLPDSRLRLVHGSAAAVDVELERLGHKAADYVISGLPFKTLPPDLCRQVALKTHSVLGSDGTFIVYQLSSVALGYLQPVFGRIRQESEGFSLMPARFFYCRR